MMPPDLALLMTGSKFLSFRLPWAALHSAACFQAVRPFLQKLILRSVMLSGLLLLPLRLLLRLLRLSSWLPLRSWMQPGS